MSFIPQKIGLIAHPGKPGAAKLVEMLYRELLLYQVTVKLEASTAALIGQVNHLSISSLGESCDLLMVLGGDGTILKTVHDLGQNLKPILGINLGLLGFLTCLSSTEYKQAALYAATGAFQLSQRTLLEVEIQRSFSPDACAASRSKPSLFNQIGLNDVVVSRGALSRLVRLETRINGELLTEYNADGLIVSTPTGSTAYSLSAGGPLLAPDSGVFAITPICPHTMTNRTVIVHDHAFIEVCPRQQREELYLTVDGQRSIRFGPSDTLRISRAKQTFPLAILQHTTFFEIARRKLKWSGASSS